LGPLILEDVLNRARLTDESMVTRGVWKKLDWRRNKLKIAVLLALALRLIVCACVAEDRTEPSRKHWNFGYETGFVAASVANGNGFSNPLFGRTGPSAWLAPAYPLLLSGIFHVLGTFSLASACAILAFNSLCGALTCIPIYFSGKRIFGELTGGYAAMAWALFPYSVYLDAYWVWDTALSTLVLTLLLWLTLELAERKRSLLDWAGYGALCGLGALINPTILAPLPFLSGWGAIRQKGLNRNALPALATAGIACVLTVSPWLVRNYNVFHEPFLIKNNFWLEVTVGNLGSHRHWWNDNQHPSRNIGELQEMMRIGESGYMAEKKHEALQFVESHLATYLWMCVRRFVYTWFGFWSVRLDYLVDEPMDPVNMVFCSTLSLMAFWGLARSWHQKYYGVLPCATILVTLPVVHYLSHPFVSYRHPVDPEIVLLGTFAAWPMLAEQWKVSTLRAALLKYRSTRDPIYVPIPALARIELRTADEPIASGFKQIAEQDSSAEMR